MCGITGIIGERCDEAKFRAATDRVAHRGPDDHGYFVDHENRVYLGHRRLSIIDLSTAGHQPFSDSLGRYKLVFNGEIYNYLELRQELREEYHFVTDTDTEVLLVSYMKWGEDCVRHFNGMFAFAIWDTKRRELFCARDRMGEKPFFYTETNGALRFASEIKSLLPYGHHPQNESMVRDYLLYGFYDHTDETFFEGIHSLPPGHTLTFANGKKTIKKYWDIADGRGAYSYGDAETVKKTFTELLADSIRLRFRSDVPVGINLSSGLDSNTLYFYAKQVVSHDLHLFSMCSDDERYNECGTIAQSLSDREKRFWHTSTLVPDEFIPGALAMNDIQDQPYGGVPTIAYGKLIERTKDTDVKVLLEGQGVDELLAGYAYYRIEHVKDLWRERKYPQLIEYVRKQKAGRFLENVKSVFRDARLSSHDYSQDRTPLVDSDILDASLVGSAVPVAFEAPFDSHLQNAQYRDLRYTKLPRVLRFNDLATMAHGRELRLPFLDHRIVEFCFWLPVEHKISYNSQKVLARKAFAHVLPEHIQRKQKVAFGAVQTPWLRAYGKDFVHDILRSQSFRERGYWNYGRLSDKVDRFFAGEGENSFFLWQVINLELWFRRYIDR